MAVISAHPRAIHGNLATMEPDLSLGPAPAVTDAAAATIMRRAASCCTSSQRICSMAARSGARDDFRPLVVPSRRRQLSAWASLQRALGFGAHLLLPLVADSSAAKTRFCCARLS